MLFKEKMFPIKMEDGRKAKRPESLVFYILLLLFNSPPHHLYIKSQSSSHGFAVCTPRFRLAILEQDKYTQLKE